MTLRQTLLLVVLTVIYLCFELAFNARLLDVVGAAVEPDVLHAFERWGRTLSGVAIALFVMQPLLARRNLVRAWYTHVVAILAFCTLAGGATFWGLQQFTDFLVDDSSGQFRRASVSMVLVQRAVHAGTWEIEQFNDAAGIFDAPEGRAVLALLPLMGTSLVRLDAIVERARLGLIKDRVGAAAGGPQAYFERYADAVEEASDQYERYRRGTAAADAGEVQARQDQAWNDYLRELGQRGLSPYSIPEWQRPQILRKVRERAPVPHDWDFADEQGFRAAVAAQIERKRAAAQRQSGFDLAPGMTWPEFFAHPHVQRRMSKALGLPATVRLRPSYDEQGFLRTVYEPMRDQQARQLLPAYRAPAPAFADGGEHAALGREMARAALVPPLALFFSLLGALLHLGKLTYLASRGALQLAGHDKFSWAAAGAAGIVLACLLALHQMDNALTRGHLFQVLTRDMLSEDNWRARLKVAAVHGVAVGQAFTYPFNEAIRTRVLGGLTFGYRPAADSFTSPQKELPHEKKQTAR